MIRYVLRSFSWSCHFRSYVVQSIQLVHGQGRHRMVPGSQASSSIRREPEIETHQPIKKPKATWGEPKFFADVEYRDITSEGLLRASSFKGLSRNDKS